MNDDDQRLIKMNDELKLLRAQRDVLVAKAAEDEEEFSIVADQASGWRDRAHAAERERDALAQQVRVMREALVASDTVVRSAICLPITTHETRACRRVARAEGHRCG